MSREGGDLHHLKLILTPEELARVTFVHGDITDLAAREEAALALSQSD